MSLEPKKLVASIDDDALASSYGKSLLSTQERELGEINAICTLAETFEALDFCGVSTPLFPNQLNWALFFDASTRTKSSWAGAAARLGSQPVIVDASSTQVTHGETARETGTMLGMNAHAIGIRHDLIVGQGNRFMREAKRGIDDYLLATGNERKVPVVNLQCDVDHPTQALADLCWLRQQFGAALAGKKVAVTWAYSPSYAKPLSVAQGLVTLLTRLGMNVHLAAPKGYDLMPECLDIAKRNAAASGGSFVQGNDMDQAFAGAHVVYPKSWGPYDLMLERVDASRQGDADRMRDIEAHALQRNTSCTAWICDERRMGITADALYMHCLPADIGGEVAPSVMDRFRVQLARQANKKVYVIMALLAAAKKRDLKEYLARRVVA